MPESPLICPLEHESGVLGSHPSLAYRLWQLLAPLPGGKTLDALRDDLGVESVSKSEIEAVLQQSKYFLKQGGGAWVLSVHRLLRWGIAGCGKIGQDFAAALSLVPGAHLTAVATAASKESAQVFAATHGAAKAYGSYQQLALDPEVDIVYVAMVHTGHAEAALQMMAGGKHVLVEKPMAMNHAEAVKMVAAAKKQGVFLMEGMWSRFHPAEQALRALLRSGAIGEPLLAEARFTFQADTSTRRLFDLALGGGALLDIGIYPLALMGWIFEQPQPEELSAMGALNAEGADVVGSVQLRYGGRAIGVAQWSFLQDSPRVAHIYGSRGHITMERVHCPEKLTVSCSSDAEVQELSFPHPQDVAGAAHGPAQGFNFSGSAGFVYEAMAVHSAVLKGWKEMDDMTHADSLGMAKTMDSIRAQIRLVYPQDRQAGGMNIAQSKGSDDNTESMQAAGLTTLALDGLG